MLQGFEILNDLFTYVIYLQNISLYLFGVYILFFLLLLPGWLRRQAGMRDQEPLEFGDSLLYLLSGPYFVVVTLVWRFGLQWIFQILVLFGGLIFAFFPFGMISRTIVSSYHAFTRFLDNLWDANLSTGQLLATSTRRNNLRTRSSIEWILTSIASIHLLRKGAVLKKFIPFGWGEAIPSVLAALAQDETQKLETRLKAVKQLSDEGSMNELVTIARNMQSSTKVITEAAEALETREEWQDAAYRTWLFLLGHNHPETRLLAAEHLKLQPAAQEKAVTCLRVLFRDESILRRLRIRAAAALSRINQLTNDENEVLLDWMNNSPDHSDRLFAAYSVACKRQVSNAFGKLRRYCYEYQHEDYLRLEAIEYLGRLDQANDLRPLSRLMWVNPDHRYRAAEILRENGHPIDAARSWLELAQDVRAPAATRQKAIQQACAVYLGLPGSASRTLLEEALARLGSEGEPMRLVRLEAAHSMVKLQMLGPARQIFLVLSRSNNPETRIRQEAARALQRLTA
jgi:hypothetical protein